MLRFFLTLVVLTCYSVTNAQEDVPPGIEKMKVLSSLIGTWQSADDEDQERTTTFKWINNNSYIEMVAGSYREIIGWDLTDKKIVSWGFGTHGGQGKYVWVEEGENAWTKTSDWLDRWGNKSVLTVKTKWDADMMTVSVQWGEKTPTSFQSKRIGE